MSQQAAPERSDMTQCEMIKKHLQERGSITPKDARDEYGCDRLSARIADLKLRGMDIITEMETSKNRFGKKIRYARYRIKQ